VRVRAGVFSSAMNPRLDCRGWTALHYASAFSNVQVAKLLVESGADVKASSSRVDKSLSCLISLL
jgi:ankyrin repeat protein